uniref:Kinesin family member 6 n=1 Tax=Cynoglossus semilaevis TaxID=244447 RepID=A0A3P8UIF5_CYNSE
MESPADSAASSQRRDTVKQKIQIFGRIKPSKKPSAKPGASLEFVVPKDLADGFVNNKKECYRFRFQKVFDQTVKQEEIFQNIAKPVADSVLAGYNGTIFAYGQTGSGKTFTITGGAERYSDRGIIPRTLSYLFDCFSQDSSMIYTTNISYLEIYNELGYDLLDSRREASRLEDLPRVSIMEDADQNIHLRNLSLQQAGNEEEALNLLFLGDTNRMIAETPMNQASTRSHCVFTMHLCRREPGSATVRRSKLHLVDLAGSDRVSKTGLYGQQLTEAKYINLSLHYLEQVIIALSEKNRSHIPYRNSMLTSVLRDSLGGNCMTTMIATMAIDKRNVDVSTTSTGTRLKQSAAGTADENGIQDNHHSAEQVITLKETLSQRDNEISILRNKNKQKQTNPGPQLSMGQQEAFETFMKDHDDHLTIDDNKNLLKQRSRQLTSHNVSTRTPSSEPCPHVCSTAGVTGSPPEAEEGEDALEETLCRQITQEKQSTEIEHLQLLLEKTKVKIQRDFRQWWSHWGAPHVEVTLLIIHKHLIIDHFNLQFSSFRCTRLTPSSIPLTGDQQTDADIMAFIRARQNLLHRTGNCTWSNH